MAEEADRRQNKLSPSTHFWPRNWTAGLTWPLLIHLGSLEMLSCKTNGKGKNSSTDSDKSRLLATPLACETVTFRSPQAVADCPRSSRCLVLGFPLCVHLKRESNYSRRDRPCWTIMGTRRQCGCRLTFFSYSTATVLVSSPTPSVVGW